MAIDDNTTYGLTGAQVKDLADKVKEGKVIEVDLADFTPIDTWNGLYVFSFDDICPDDGMVYKVVRDNAGFALRLYQYNSDNTVSSGTVRIHEGILGEAFVWRTSRLLSGEKASQVFWVVKANTSSGVSADFATSFSTDVNGSTLVRLCRTANTPTSTPQRDAVMSYNNAVKTLGGILASINNYNGARPVTASGALQLYYGVLKNADVLAGDGISLTKVAPTTSASGSMTISSSAFTGTDGATDGTLGAVPAPLTTDADKFLKSDGTWAAAGGGSGVIDVDLDTLTPSSTSGTTDYFDYDVICPDPNVWYRIHRSATSGNSKTVRMYSYDGAGVKQSTSTMAWGADEKGRYAFNLVPTNDSTGTRYSRISWVVSQTTSYPMYISYSGTSTVTRVCRGWMNGTDYVLGNGSVVNNLTTTDYTQVLSAAQGKVLNDKITAITPAIETYTIADTAWTALASSSPYTYSATVTATHTIGNNTVIEMLNDQPVLFAEYGFAVGATSGQTVTIYSIGAPSSSTTLKVRYTG